MAHLTILTDNEPAAVAGTWREEAPAYHGWDLRSRHFLLALAYTA